MKYIMLFALVHVLHSAESRLESEASASSTELPSSPRSRLLKKEYETFCKTFELGYRFDQDLLEKKGEDIDEILEKICAKENEEIRKRCAERLRRVWRAYYLKFLADKPQTLEGAKEIVKKVFPSAVTFQVYGLDLDTLYFHGFEFTARTLIELTQDKDLKPFRQILQKHFCGNVRSKVVVDPFLGSGATLVGFCDALQIPGIGFEIMDNVFEATKHSLHKLGLNQKIILNKGDSTKEFEIEESINRLSLDTQKGADFVIFLSPPWEDAMENGELDIAKTKPSVNAFVKAMTSKLREFREQNEIDLSFTFCVQIKKKHKKSSVQALEEFVKEANGESYGVLYNHETDTHGLLTLRI